MIIEVKNLTKVYKLKQRKEGLKEAVKTFIKPTYYEKRAVDNISFSINEGECVGYIGENGAGKSTTIKMLTGILYPTSGDVVVNGLIPYKNSTKNNFNIGTVFGQRSALWWDLPVIDSFKLNKTIYNIPDSIYEENMKNYNEILKLNELLHIPVRNLSLGQRMKCEIALAFLHNPKVVYLDEPTIGLDVLVKEDIRNFLAKNNREKNTTILLTTHDLSDIEAVCKRIIIIDNGRILYDGNLKEFINIYGKTRIIKFKLKDDYQKEEIIKKLVKELINEYEFIENELKITFNKQSLTPNNIINIVSEHAEIEDINIIEPNLEGIVKEIYRGTEDD